MSEIRKLDDPQPSEVAYYEGYHRGHVDTAKMLGRRSLMYLFIGAFLGGGFIFLLAGMGVLNRLSADKVTEDPALSQEKPKEYVNAINWAKRFTEGIVAKTSGRTARTVGGFGSIPGQTHVGSGVILTEDGYVLTNAHVIPSDAEQLSVVLGDEMYEARFVGHRPEYDIAVIKIVATNLVAASLGDSDKVEQGDVAVAIGSPHGPFHTSTEGSTGYVGRRSSGSGSLVPNFLQTSAAINPGNSGGPLIDIQGRVIGINTWKLADQGGSVDGIGFAIPINIARRVYEVIINGDDRERDTTIGSRPRSLSAAFLGVQIDTGFRPESEPGAKIREVIYGTAADEAGLRPGDLIVAVNGAPVTGFDDLKDKLNDHAPDDRVQLTYRRNGKDHTIEVKLRR